MNGEYERARAHRAPSTASFQSSRLSSSLPKAERQAPGIVHDVVRKPGEALGARAEMGLPRAGYDFSGLRVQTPSPAEPLAVNRPDGPDEKQAKAAESALATPNPTVPGADLSQVRIHLGPQAETSARMVGALAYTVGNHIVFGAGQFNPHSVPGQRLLAHELAHVAQNAGAPAPLGVQRYESPEHQDLGDKYLGKLYDDLQTDEGKQWAKSKGLDPAVMLKELEEDPMRKGRKIKVRPDLELSPGDVIALMGDLYASPTAIKKAPKKEITDLLDTMKKERSGVVNADVEYEKITGGRYTDLAKANAPHFAPTNKETWKKMHLEAIALAQRAGREKDEDAFEEALLIDAAGGHFLTDSFAAGHLIDSSKVTVAIHSYLKEHPIPSASNPEMQGVNAAMQAANLAPYLALKNIHDRLNAEGFEVSNPKGMRWKTFGDNHLKNAVETQRIAAYAVAKSRQQIFRAKEGQTPNENDVLELLPDAKTVEAATNRAYSYIPQAVAEIPALIHRKRDMLDTAKVPGGKVLLFPAKSILGTISDPGRQKQLEEYDRKKQLDPTTPYPVPPLLRWDF